MTDIAPGALEAHPFGLNRRPHSAFHPVAQASRLWTLNPRTRISHPHDRLYFIPGVAPALLPRPESHSP